MDATDECIKNKHNMKRERERAERKKIWKEDYRACWCLSDDNLKEWKLRFIFIDEDWGA